ncbi:MAG: ATPase [Rhizobiaceae bacterium]|nr:ATPase [Rhizobiaceae bacterium]
MSEEPTRQKQQARLLKLLMKASVGGLPVKSSGSKIIISFQGRDFSFPKAVYVQGLTGETIVVNDGCLEITDVGRVVARKLLYPDIEFETPLQSRCNTAILAAINSKSDSVVLNLSESPLMRLYSRKDKNGQRYITSEELAAGEKLRSDFEKANLQPSVSASWDGNIVGKNSSRAGNRQSELSDFAIDSRKYVERAVERLGPELSGIALDICCFLKGLELVERERHWPPRSAKLMLKTALSVLARHYGFSQNNERSPGHIEHWGDDSYRPGITTR